MKKQRIILIAALICCLALAATGTLAFFTAKEVAYNVITTGELAMDLVEMHGDEPWPVDGVDGVVPGVEVSKVVTIQNLGSVDFYTRVKVTGEIKLADGSVQEMTPELVELIGLNTTDWTEKDGYYYYNKALAASADATPAETEPLFTAVKLKPELGNEYQKAELNVHVKAQAVQSRNNTDSPLTAAGWDE